MRPKEKNLFSIQHLEDGLGRRSARGGAITFAAQASKFAIQIGSTAVLARVLTPGDFGLVAMVAVFTGILQLLKNLGLSMATVQRAEVTHDQVSALFWINVLFSAVLAMVVAACAPLIASFYEEPALANVTIAIGATIALSGIAVQHTALLQRQMRFGTIASIEIVSRLLGACVAIVLALNGASYWALVAMLTTEALATAVLSIRLTAWLPGKPRFDKNTFAMLRFGGNLTGASLMGYVTRNADNLLVGRFCGKAELGVYSRAYGLLLMPLRQLSGPIAAVAIPALSRLQHKPEEYRRYFLRAVQVIAYLTMPFVVLLAVLSEDVVLLVLGEQWAAASHVFLIFSIFAFFQPVIGTASWVITSLGRGDRMLKWSALQAAIAVPVFTLGLPWGAPGVATAATTMALIMMVPAMAYALHGSGISLWDIAQTIQRPLLIAGTLLAFSLCAYQVTRSYGMPVRMVAVIGSAALVAMLAFAASSSLRADSRLIARALRR